MSRVPDDLSTSSQNFQIIFVDALKQYKKRTRKDIASHTLAAQIKSCDSPDAVLTVLQTQVQTFDPSPSATKRWTSLFDPTITVLYAFSTFVSDIVGPVFPPAVAIFTGIGILLQTVQDVRAAQDILIDLFNRMKICFMRLEKCIAVRPTAAMMDIVGKILVEVISILGMAMKEIGQGLYQKYVKNLFGIQRVEDACRRLDKFTLEFPITVGESLTHVHQVQGVHTYIHGVAHEVSFINPSVPRKEIEVLSRHVGDLNRNESRKHLRQWIRPPDRSSNFNTASDAHHDGTATWCIGGKTFADWMASGSLFWIHGKPGSGKTILSSVIIRHIESLSKFRSLFLAYFYFDCKDTGKQGSRALLSSLLDQLSNQSDQLCDILRGLYSKHHDGSEQPHDDALLQCLKDMLMIARSAPIYLVVDALDECPNDSRYPSSREKVLSVVEKLVRLRLPNLRLCITSRPEWDIRTIIKPLTTQEISLHDESGQTRDINAYVTSVARSVKHWRDDDKKMVIDKLTENADGMFRWVYCKLDVLRQCHRIDLRRILKEPAQSLDETYERILKGINDTNPKQAHRLLQCLVAAHRPLRVEELADVLALDVDAGGIPRLDSKSRCEDHESAVLSTCSSLVSIVNRDASRVVQFCHTSVKEFLMSDRLSSTEDISQFYIAHEHSHAILAQACLGAFLSVDDPTSEDRAGEFPLSGYAYEYWFKHAQFGNVESHISDVLDHFFDLDKPHFKAFFRSSRARAPFHLRFFGDFLDEESKGVLSPAAPFYFAAISGLNRLAERLIVAKKPQVLNFCGHKGTLLHLAAREGHIGTARLLLAHGADINSRTDYATSPHIASLQRHSQGLESRSERPLNSGLDAIDDVENTLLDTNVNVGSEEISDTDLGLGESRCTPLHLAASEGHLDICQMLLQLNAYVRVRNKSGNTALHFAASEGHLEVTHMLLKRGADINSQNKEGLTPLQRASQGMRKGYLNIMRLLLDYGANCSARDKSGNTALHFAVSNGHFEATRMLLERGADVNSQNDKGLTPLQRASRGMWKGYLDIIRLLLDHGAKLTARDNSGNTALHFAVSGGPPRTAHMLLERGADVNSQNNKGLTPLQQVSQSMREGYLDIMRFLLDHGANWDSRDNHGNTILHFAASEGHLETARLLLERGADINSQNKEGLTPLQQASRDTRRGYLGIVDIVRFLLDHGANVDARDNCGNTALHFAVSEGLLETAHLLLKQGADVNSQNNVGLTPLQRASQGELLIEPVRLLDHEPGADVDFQSDQGLTRLRPGMLRMGEEYLDIIRLLLDNGANWNSRDNHGNTALHFAASKGHLKTARILLKRSVEVDSQNYQGSTPLLVASEHGTPDLVQLFLKYKADVHVCDAYGDTVLHRAAIAGQLGTSRLLLGRIGVNSRNKWGSTPLHLASAGYEKGNLGLVQLLLDRGADAQARNLSGKTASAVARGPRRDDIVKLISQHTAE